MFNNLNIKKITLWLSITILACLAIATLLFFEIDMKNLQNDEYQYDVNAQKSFASEEIKEINIDSFSSDINIIEYDDTEVKVHIYGKLYTKTKSEENEPEIELIEGRLSIKENRKSNISVGINLNIGELFRKNEIQIDLFVPKGYKNNMKIDSSSGDVKADSMNLNVLDINTFSGNIKLNDLTAEAVKLETSSGNISAGKVQAKDIKVDSFSGNNDFESIKAQKVYFENSSGNLSLGTVETEEITGSTFSGDITAEELKSNYVNMNTSSGNIRIEGATVGMLKGKTFSGNIIFNNASLNNSEIDTSSGNVTIKLLEGSEFSLVADSSSGNVSCNFPLTMKEKQGKHEIRGVVGKDNNKIEINTFSGDIKIIKQ